LAEIESLYRQRLQDCQRLRGSDDPETLQVLTDLGAFLGIEDKLDEASQLLGRAVETSRRKLGLDHSITLMRQNQLARVLEKQGESKGAIALYQETLEVQRRVRGPKHTDALITQINLSVLLAKQGEKMQAEALSREMMATGLQTPIDLDRQTDFDGDWRGGWGNSVGESGEERLSLREKADGTITGVWSWSGISIPISGERLGKSTFIMQASTDNRFYRVLGAGNGRQLLLHYSSSRLNKAGAYYGRSVLTMTK
jgi:hypothetical protein